MFLLKRLLPFSRLKTKNDIGHGFGLKSIKYIAKKYDGNMYWANNDGIFSLQIMIPVQTVPS